ncbi:flagellar biosynthesis protein FlhF [Sporosarcina highlanderae]|uniref:Flagellar biosynthesis protein FlhF n=1 Tax=Sporosarcina highlanderae TaxID=3035916 RepID=A0ABT8JQL3_9BACL|nr:flagellar biosynthesis protein FlhF [Sporosarcina highlanderae]MDN4607446.1 flagellar biosynthesis protein FlhF [Sporosarcina highlanderae]
MKMKKYTADTMVEAMKQVRKDLGDEAVILSSSVVKSKGFLGLFRRKSVEVVAGLDRSVSKPAETIFLPKFSPVEKQVDLEMQKEMNEMKKLLQEMKQVASFGSLPEELQPLLSYLEQQDLSKEFILQIGNEIFAKMKLEKKDFSKGEQLQIVRDFLTKEFADLPFGGISFNKKYVNLLGPTGVGKTTTIAKIAARAVLENRKKIGFITTDTYRIAAIEQLRTYANLLQAPVEVVYNSNDFKAAIDKMKDLDLIFIDTAGRNYMEKKFLDDLNRVIDFSLNMESFLVLSVTSKEADMKKIVEMFSSFPIEKFIFTKVDETSSIGQMFNLMKQYRIGTAYFTDGQEVPEDIIEACLEEMLNLLLVGDRNE